MSAMDRLTYIGHGTTLLRLGELSILTDPMLRNWLGPLHRQVSTPDPELPERCDVVLISHIHRDHLDVPSLRRFPSSTPLVVPRGVTKWARRGGAAEIHELGVGESISFGEVEVKAVKALHNGYRDRTWGERIQPLGYLIHAGGRTVYFAGDTDLYPEMSDLGPVDVALLPVWGWGSSVGEGHLDPPRAAMAVEAIRPRLAVPIHWGTFAVAGMRRRHPENLVEPPLEFARLTNSLAPDVEVRVLQPGEATSLEDAG
jgi:L-ascorbate metabolism protein UlaG (beta-lactamase superfamily)